MAHYIFKDIEDFKNHVGGTINRSVQMKGIAHCIIAAYENHLERWIPPRIWSELCKKVEENSALSEEESKLLKLLQRATAQLTMFEHMQTGGIEISEAGFFRTDTETKKQAYKYQENSYRDWMVNQGYESMEKLILFLNENENDYNLWKGSPEQKRSQSGILNNAVDMRRVYSHHITRYTFEGLRSLIEDLEFFILKALWGVALFQDIKEKLEEDNLSEKEKELVLYAQKIIAYFTIEDALKRDWIKLKNNSVVYNQALENQSYIKAEQATIQQLNITTRHNNQYANRYVGAMMSFIEKNKDNFPLFESTVETQTTSNRSSNTKGLLHL